VVHTLSSEALSKKRIQYFELYKAHFTAGPKKAIRSLTASVVHCRQCGVRANTLVLSSNCIRCGVESDSISSYVDDEGICYR